jgi:hypothetical protein
MHQYLILYIYKTIINTDKCVTVIKHMFKVSPSRRTGTSQSKCLTQHALYTVFQNDGPDLKSTRRASRELAIPHTTVWPMLRRRLRMRPYRLQLAQAFRAGDKERRVEYSDAMLQNMEDDSL